MIASDRMTLEDLVLVEDLVVVEDPVVVEDLVVVEGQDQVTLGGSGRDRTSPAEAATR